MATTSQLNSAYLYGYFKKHLEKGDDVLYLAFSSGLSGTCSNGMLAANDLQGEFPERKLVVVALAKWVQSDLIPHANAWFTVDDLKFLKRGGRISAATAALGTMLSIKPVLHVDDEGHLIAMSKERGLDTIDLVSPMAGLSRAEYWRDDYHFTAEAVNMQAEIIAGYVLEAVETAEGAAAHAATLTGPDGEVE